MTPANQCRWAQPERRSEFIEPRIDAWILYGRGHSDWRWLLVCVLIGPISIAPVFDQMYLVEPEVTPDDVDVSTAGAEPLVEENGMR